MDDGRIIELLFARDEEALKNISEKYGSLCQKVAYGILGDRGDAEECVSDAYLGVWHTIPPKKPDNLAGYVIRIVRNTASKRYRKNTAKKRNSRYDSVLDELCDFLPSDESVERFVELKEAVAEINLFLEALECESRVMFVRRYYFAESVADIAREMTVSSHYVSVKLHRIRAKLKEYLCERGIYL